MSIPRGRLTEGIVSSVVLGACILFLQPNSLSASSKMEAGGGYSLALQTDGTVWTWGRNYLGQLGDGKNITRLMPLRVSNLSGVVDVAAGGLHSLALKGDGTVWVWRSNDYGQLGDGTKINKWTPIQVSNLTRVVAIAANDWQTCPPGLIHILSLGKYLRALDVSFFGPDFADFASGGEASYPVVGIVGICTHGIANPKSHDFCFIFIAFCTMKWGFPESINLQKQASVV